MSHRTQDLPPLTGLPRLFRDLRYVEPARQGFAVLLILVYTYVATPLPELATDGPYRFVRHPLYSGNILLVVGFGLACSRWWALPLAALFFWFYYPPAIEYEDRKLHGIFGEAWERWAARTPALVPRFGAIPPAGAEDRRWSIGVSSARTGEIVFLLLMIGCIAWVAWRAFG
jgi:hypothetical protein